MDGRNKIFLGSQYNQQQSLNTTRTETKHTGICNWDT